MFFYRIPLPRAKATVFLSGEEIQSLLLKDIDLYKLALSRGKGITRAEDKRAQYEKKFSSYENKALNKLQGSEFA